MPQPRLPNEVLLKVFDSLYEKYVSCEEELKNARLVSKQFNALANVYFFKEIKLDRYSEVASVERFSQTVDLLCQPHIAVHIRSVAISGKSLFPVSILPTDRGFFSRFTSQPIEEDGPDSKIAAFKADIYRLLICCQSQLQRLKLESASFPNTSGPSEADMQIAESATMLTALGILGTVEFPMLKRLSFHTDIPPPQVSYLFKTSCSNPDELRTLERNVRKVQDVSISCPLNSDIDSDIDAKPADPQFTYGRLGWPCVGYLDLRRLKINTMTALDQTLATRDIGRHLGLTELSLSYVVVEDFLSQTIQKLTALRRVRLCQVVLKPEMDRWDDVCSALLASTTLRDIITDFLRYGDAAHDEMNCEVSGLCSPYPADILSYKKLFARREDLIKQELMERGLVASWNYCHDEKFEALEEDLENNEDSCCWSLR